MSEDHKAVSVGPVDTQGKSSLAEREANLKALAMSLLNGTFNREFSMGRGRVKMRSKRYLHQVRHCKACGFSKGYGN